MRALSNLAAMDANREAADRDKLVGPLVHELRNSVAPIVNALHLLRRRFKVDSSFPGELRLIERQVSDIIETLDSITEAQHLAHGEIGTEYQRLELASVLRSAMNDKLPVIDRRAQHLHLRSPHNPIWIDADQKRLARAIGSVIDAAARRAGEGGDIWIDIVAKGDEVEVNVRDEVEDAAPSESAGRSRATNQAPALGLVIARALVELHGGSITVYSSADGEGNEFAIRLPRAAQPRRAGASANDPVMQTESVLEHAWPATNRRVLLVDDNEAVRTSFAAVLRDLGHEVRLAADGAEALRLAEQWRPEFVVLDIHMPKINGYDLARTLRSRFPPAAMQLVMMSGTTLDAATVVGAKSAGFDYCVDKLSAVVSLEELLRGASRAP
jgi:CheY-like chemotaxis protein